MAYVGNGRRGKRGKAGKRDKEERHREEREERDMQERERPREGGECFKAEEEGVCRYPSPPAGVEREQRGRRQKTWFSVPRPAPGAPSEAGWGGCERK